MRLQESMLFVPTATRTNFWARKLTSLVAFEHENMPNRVGTVGIAGAAEAGGGRVERVVPGGGAQHAVAPHERLGEAGQAFGRSMALHAAESTSASHPRRSGSATQAQDPSGIRSFRRAGIVQRATQRWGSR